jgi:hypothetical protein
MTEIEKLNNFKTGVLAEIKMSYPEKVIDEKVLDTVIKYLKNYYDKYSNDPVNYLRLKPKLIDFFMGYSNINQMNSTEILRILLGKNTINKSIEEINISDDLDDLDDLDDSEITPILDKTNINMEDVDGGRRRRKTKRRQRKTKRRQRKTKRRQRKTKRKY